MRPAPDRRKRHRSVCTPLRQAPPGSGPRPAHVDEMVKPFGRAVFCRLYRKLCRRRSRSLLSSCPPCLQCAIRGTRPPGALTHIKAIVDARGQRASARVFPAGTLGPMVALREQYCLGCRSEPAEFALVLLPVTCTSGEESGFPHKRSFALRHQDHDLRRAAEAEDIARKRRRRVSHAEQQLRADEAKAGASPRLAAFHWQ